MTITPNSVLADKTVGYIEDNYRLNIVLVRHDHQSEMHPTDAQRIQAGDTLAVLGGPAQLARLVHDND
ncbi:MAG: TrkA C-terminal domain-containing protein [Anaerolineales bacterium]|nr:TrkA C-terminal domain-containing protein [Anaerolineales bacterium]